MTWHKWWGASQWAAYLENMELPVKRTSKLALIELAETQGDRLAPKDMASLMLEDPLLTLRLLKAANQHLPRRMGHDITTPLGVVMSLGTRRFWEQLELAPEISEENAGFIACEAGATRAARIAMALGGFHHDTDSSELGLAALLANAGGIELWAFAPELPLAALEKMRSGEVERSEEAQILACGFAFRELTLLMCEHWQLPPLILQLIRGDQSTRARLARLAVDMSRHQDSGVGNRGLEHDLQEVMKLTGASRQALLNVMPCIKG